MNYIIKNKRLYFFLATIAILNILQSYFTNISKDASYYWMFSQNMGWGYFDHPPMIALLIRIGYSLFHNVLGVRLMTVILSFFTYVLLWELVPKESREKKNSDLVYALIVLAMPISHIYGFITTPDVPLLFFGVIYLLIFKQFIAKSSFVNALKLGVVAALLLYSKYHGVLIILLTLMPYYKLLGKINLYVAGLVGFLLFLPHLWWQYQNDFVTFIYHLNYRSDNEFVIKNIFNYLLNVVLILNPFISLFLFYYLVRKKVQLEYKAMKFIFWGFIAFFGYSSFQNHVEPHWIAMAMIPAILYLHKIILENEKVKKLMMRLIYISLPLFFAARVILMLPLPLNSEFHKEGAAYYNSIADFAADENVIFLNSFAHPSKYMFYTGKKCFTTRNIWYHKTHYDFLHLEEKYNDKPALLINHWPSKKNTYVDKKIDENMHYKRIENFPVITHMKIKIQSVEKVDTDSLMAINFSIYNPYNYDVVFNDSLKPYRLTIIKYGKRGAKFFIPVSNSIGVVKSKQTINATETFYPKGLKTNDQFGLAVAPFVLDEVLLSNKHFYKIGEY